MEIINDFLANSAYVQLFLARMPLFLAVLLYLSFAGIGSMLLSGRILGRQRKRSSYDKCAKQLGFFSLILGLPLILGGKVYLYFQTGSWLPVDIPGYLKETAWLMAALVLLYLTLYLAVWKLVQKRPLLQNILGFWCLLQGLLSTLVLLILPLIISKESLDFSHLWLPEYLLKLLPAIESRAFLALALTLPLVFAMPAVFGNLGLVCSRPFKDYGRDHYKIALSWCAGWVKACGLWVIFLIILQSGYLLYGQWAAAPQDFLIFVQSLDYIPWLDKMIFTGLWLLIVIIMAIIAKSEIPMRHTFIMFIADILALLSVYGYLDWWIS